MGMVITSRGWRRYERACRRAMRYMPVVEVDCERSNSTADEMLDGRVWAAAGWYGTMGGKIDSADGRRGGRGARFAGADVDDEASAMGGREVMGGGRGAVVWRCRKLVKRVPRAGP